tara:strand:+ start:1435 stop:2061 length:627 start_codon:yes stop_codon:yes gene_type:complete
MSLGFDDAYNKRLRQTLKEFDNPVGANRTQPEMFFRPKQNDFVLPMVKPSFPTLALALKAERGNSLAQGQHEGKMEGEGLASFVKGVNKGVKKASKSVAKGAKKVAKKTTSAALDIIAENAGVAGAAGGVALATAIGQPELAPVFAAVGNKAAEEAAKPARKLVKEKTGLGKPKRPPSKWMLHVAEYRKENGGSYKDAMKNAKATYKK